MLDTKWKRLDPADKTLSIDSADIYQMQAYGHAYGAARLVLVYPWPQEVVTGPGIAALATEVRGGMRSVGGIEVDGFLTLPAPTRQRARREKVEISCRKVFRVAQGSYLAQAPTDPCERD